MIPHRYPWSRLQPWRWKIHQIFILLWIWCILRAIKILTHGQQYLVLCQLWFKNLPWPKTSNHTSSRLSDIIWWSYGSNLILHTRPYSLSLRPASHLIFVGRLTMISQEAVSITHILNRQSFQTPIHCLWICCLLFSSSSRLEETLSGSNAGITKGLSLLI